METHFLLTLYTWKKEKVFRKHRQLRDIAERLWKQVAGATQDLRSDAFVVTANALNAIIIVSDDTPELTLEQAIADFRYLCVQDFSDKSGGESPTDVWSDNPRIRLLDTSAKRQDAEELIVQLMIQG